MVKGQSGLCTFGRNNSDSRLPGIFAVGSIADDGDESVRSNGGNLVRQNLR